MANVIYKKGQSANLDAVSVIDGQILVTEDNGEMFVDMSDGVRKKITDTNKVDKIEGKNLSTNDFTDEYKNKLDNIETEATKTIVDTTYNKETNSQSLNAQSGVAVAAAIADLVNSAPETLNTLDELSKALGDDPNFATTVATELGKKANKDELIGETTTEGGEIFNLYEDTEEDFGTIGGISIGKQTVPKNKAGQYGHAEGVGTSASGKASHAEGAGTKADAEATHAEGAGTLVTGAGSHAEGRGINFTVKVTAISGNIVTVKSNNSSIIERVSELEAIDKNAVIWYETDSSNHNGEFYYATNIEIQKTLGVASSCKITLDRAPSFTTTGVNLTIIMGAALSYMSHTEGNYCVTADIEATNLYGNEGSDKQRQHAEGSRTLALGYAAHAEGELTLAKGNKSHAEGNQTTTLGTDSHAEGYKTKTTATDAHAEGNTTEANGQAAHAEGMRTKANGKGSHTEGIDTIADGEAAHAEGARYTSPYDGTVYELIASGIGSHAEGAGVQAIGDYSHAEGLCGVASGNGAHVEGTDCKATGQYTHAEGHTSIASGQQAHAEGKKTEASGNNSHAEGYQSKATRWCAHAEGGDTQVTGEYGHAEGRETVVSGEAAHSEGKLTEARGDYSHASGLGTIASADAQTVVGKYNDVDSEFLFIVGNGIDDDNRTNAFAVYKEGTVCAGVSTKKYDSSLTLVTKDYVDNSIKDPILEYINYEFDEKNEQIIITGCEKANYFIDLPKTIEGYPVRRIGDSAFNDERCRDISNITIPDSVISIGEQVFYDCRFTNIIIPNSVENIGKSAFMHCRELKNIIIPNSITSISEEMFYGCSSLTNITIPTSVTSIGRQAFAECNNLTDVYYEGTQEQWNNIYINGDGEYGNDDLFNATIHYNQRLATVEYVNTTVNQLDNVLRDILTAIQTDRSALEKVEAIEQTIVNYLENKTVAEVE